MPRTDMNLKRRWNSNRFRKAVQLTHHAAKRMTEPAIDAELVAELIETGAIKRKDHEHWWIHRRFTGRADNPLCAAVISREALIVKTLMTHWEDQDE
jgi:hypothetical protein